MTQMCMKKERDSLFARSKKSTQQPWKYDQDRKRQHLGRTEEFNCEQAVPLQGGEEAGVVQPRQRKRERDPPTPFTSEAKARTSRLSDSTQSADTAKSGVTLPTMDSSQIPTTMGTLWRGGKISD